MIGQKAVLTVAPVGENGFLVIDASCGFCLSWRITVKYTGKITARIAMAAATNPRMHNFVFR